MGECTLYVKGMNAVKPPKNPGIHIKNTSPRNNANKRFDNVPNTNHCKNEKN